MPAPRKREARKSLGQSAWITLDGGFAARHCVVQDISSSGARISVDDAISLPSGNCEIVDAGVVRLMVLHY